MATINPGFYGHNLPAFLDLLAFAEGTSSSRLTRHDGYDVIVSSLDGPAVFTGFDAHPFCCEPKRPLQVLTHAMPPLESDAAGRYQLMAKYWPFYQRALKLPDFGPLSQDLIALQQIKERSAYFLVSSGKIEQAIAACSGTWASLPGNSYGQGGKSLKELLAFWASRGDAA